MSISLADALQQVDLQGGRVYECQIGRLRVEVRVEETVPQSLPAPLKPDDIMLDPWADLPGPHSAAVLQAVPGSPVLPDLPDLPTDAQP